MKQPKIFLEKTNGELIGVRNITSINWDNEHNIHNITVAFGGKMNMQYINPNDSVTLSNILGNVVGHIIKPNKLKKKFKVGDTAIANKSIEYHDRTHYKNGDIIKINESNVDTFNYIHKHYNLVY